MGWHLRRWWRSHVVGWFTLSIVLMLLSSSDVTGQGVGRWSRTACTDITSPVVGQTFCFDTTANRLKGWTGARWLTLPIGNPYWVDDFGAVGDGSTDDAVAIQATFTTAATATITNADLGVIGSARVRLSANKQYCVNSAINIGTNSAQSIEYALEGEGPFSSWLWWCGGNTNSILKVGRPDLGNITRFVVRKVGFNNKATSGTGVTAVRSTAINGIELNATGATAGINDVLIEEVYATNLSNFAVNTTASSVNQMTVRKSKFASLYNQTNPVVNPLTDALVTGRGNVLYFGPAMVSVQGLYLYDNDAQGVQNRFLDSEVTAFNNLVMRGNFSDPGASQRGLGVRLAAFINLDIQGNELHFAGVGGVAGTLLDLGTTSLGSSNVSGGVVMGNFLSGTGSAGQDFLKFTFADGIVVGGQSYFNTAGSALTLAGANVQNLLVLPSNYVSVTTKLTDGGAVNTNFFDPNIGYQFNGLGLQMGSPTGGSPASGRINIAAADGYLVNNTALKNISETLSNKTLASPEVTGPNITAGSGTGVTVNNAGALRSLVYKVTVLSTNCVAAALTCDLTIATLPAKTFLKRVFADLTTTYACASVCTTATLSGTLGTSAGGTELLASMDLDAATARFGDADAELGASMNAAARTANGALIPSVLMSWTGTTTVTYRITSGTGNLGDGAATNLSQGTIVFYLETDVYP